MPRTARNAPGRLIYHVLNRANGRQRLFRGEKDYLAFEKALVQAHQRTPVEIYGWCIMPNHFHFLLGPRHDGDLSNFMRWLTLTHTQRWKTAHQAIGEGHLYQGRFKSFPVQDDEHFRAVLRYVERNPLRAAMVERAEAWRWGSLHARQTPEAPLRALLSESPVELPRNWLAVVNQPQNDAEENAVRLSIQRSRPLGDPAWTNRMARKLGLEWSLRDRGRQKGWRKQKSKK